ncbi:hypothetical protein, partial [Serratia marcescens]|uniref:hypothetical protein n=1 Tax=Serratia marcescens TaxID=615 RepID=UPI0028140743
FKNETFGFKRKVLNRTFGFGKVLKLEGSFIISAIDFISLKELIILAYDRLNDIRRTHFC